MDEITKEWFSSARERYVGAVRFAVVLLAVLFGIQLTTFTEYLDTQTRLRHAKAQAEEARALTDAMREVAAAADALQQTVTDNLKGLLSRLVEELKGILLLSTARSPIYGATAPFPRSLGET
jgi:type II secretory pathway pseudopilin PulG